MKKHEINCVICGRKKPYKYAKTCGSKDCIKISTQSTNLEKYGHICSVNGNDPSRKRLLTLQNHYGSHITNVSQVSDVKKKKKDTCKKNFGVDYPMQSAIVREKSVLTCINKYGVDNCSKNQDIIDTIIKTRTAPDEHGININQRAHNKRVESNQSQYGVSHYFQTKEFKKQYIDIMMERYGVENYFQSDEFNRQMIKLGLRYSESDLTRLEVYRRDVYRSTENNVRQFYNEIKNLSVRSNDFHLDHIYSIVMGFRNNIESDIISCIPNLQILNSSLNIAKGATCWITETELKKRYEKWKISHHIM